MKDTDYKEELLKWQYEQIKFRKLYESTPAGINQEKYDELMKDWTAELEQYKESKKNELLPGMLPSREKLIGRDDKIQKIKKAFADGKRNLFLFGIGGIGKSTLAINYIYDVGDEYDRIIFLTISKSIKISFVDDSAFSVSNMQYSIDKYASLRNYYQKKIDVLKEHISKEKILIVLDDYNLINDKELDVILSLNCDKIFTSRLNPNIWSDRDFYKKIHGIEIDAINDKDLLEFIRYYAKSEKFEEDLYNYGKSVYNHPLKVKLAVVNYSSGNTKKWEGENLLSCFSLKRIEKDILMYLAVLPKEGILRNLFEEVTKVEKKTIDILIDYMLITPITVPNSRDVVLTIHPVIRDEVLSLYKPTVKNCSAFIKAWGDYMDGTTNGVITWERSFKENRRLEQYIFAIMEAFAPVAWLATSFEEIATFLWIQQYYSRAQRYAHKIYNSVLKYYGENHKITAREALRVAAAYYNALDYEAANKWYLKAYEHFKGIADLDIDGGIQLLILHEKLIRMSRCACNFKDTKFYLIEAEKLKKSLENKAFSNKQLYEFELAYCYIILEKSRCLLAEGDLTKALEVYKIADISLKKLVDNGYRHAEFDEYYADLLLEQGKISEATCIYERLVTETIEYRDYKYRETLIRRERLADVYAQTGNISQAKEQYETVMIVLQNEYPFQKEWMDSIRNKIINC